MKFRSPRVRKKLRYRTWAPKFVLWPKRMPAVYNGQTLIAPDYWVWLEKVDCRDRNWEHIDYCFEPEYKPLGYSKHAPQQ